MTNTVSLIIVAFAAPASAWWGNGHMLTAAIAQQELQERAPEVFDKANHILEQLETKYENAHPFVESATFPDKFKYHGFEDLAKESPVNVHGPWHFYDQPYFKGMDPKKVTIPKENVVDAIKQLRPLISEGNADKLTSYQLRCLIHFLGDIHQPLHATDMYSDEFPNGDRGGNSYKLKSHDHINELHALWDSVVDKFGEDWDEPLNDDDWKTIMDNATRIRNVNPRGRLFLTSTDPMDWANESYALSKQFVYSTPEHEWPTDQYINLGQRIAEQRLAYGGYRLADILMNLWGKKEEAKFLW